MRDWAEGEGGQPARPGNFLFFLDKQLSLKIKATHPGFWHCTGDPSASCKHFRNLGLKHPAASRGRDLGLQQASSAGTVDVLDRIILCLGGGGDSVLGTPSLYPLDAWSTPPNCDDPRVPGEQNLLGEEQEVAQGPSLAPPVGAETEASNMGTANGADLAWPPRVHPTIPANGRSRADGLPAGT